MYDFHVELTYIYQLTLPVVKLHAFMSTDCKKNPSQKKFNECAEHQYIDILSPLITQLFVPLLVKSTNQVSHR